jgi:hypothetical protein
LNVYILVVDDEPDVEALFRQQFDFALLRHEIDTRLGQAA